jgi:alanine racemase
VLHYREEGFGLDMVRPGLLTYGVYPDSHTGGLSLRPAMAVRCRVRAVTHHKKGDAVSYGRTWTAERDCTLAVLPMGYADGLHRALSGKLEVLLHGRRVKQVGRICMDMCMVDVTDLPDVQSGDVATVLGEDGDACITANELAQRAGTIPYEILCAISPRVPRVYVD